jgi:SHS2 domain-containing protein
MQLSECTFEELGHTAEVGLAVQAPTPAQLFACAARGMFALLRVEVDGGEVVDARRVSVSAYDAESLLVDWLNELVYLYETTGALYTHCAMESWEPTALTAEVAGYRPASAPAIHIKAVTYHQLSVRQEGEHWSARVFFDI